MPNVSLGYAYFPDFAKGRPVFNGSIFVGKIGKDPEIEGNQQQLTIVQEDGTEVEVSQPIGTGNGGVPTFNGSPVKLKVPAGFSLKVLNSAGKQVYNDPDSRTDDEFTVEDFGAEVGGTADNFAAIQAANDAAAAAGKSLRFQDGIYAIDVQVGAPLKPTTTWFSHGGALLQNTNLGLTTDSEFVQIDAQTDLTFVKINLDGQITITGSSTPNLDQPTPLDANVDDYTRCSGWNVKNGSANIFFTECRTANIYRNSFRAESSSKDVTYSRCSTNRNRGTFGDAFYSQRVRNVKYIACKAFDYTRIGFVFEGRAVTNNASDFCNITDCYAEFAHDNHSSENNVGFWVENGQQVTMKGNHAINTVAGFLLSATDSQGDAIANGGVLSQVRTYNFSDNEALSVKGGLSINPDDKDAIFNITNFNAHIPDKTAAEFNGTATQFGFDIIGVKIGSTDFIVNLTNCGGYIDNTSYAAALDYGFLGILQPSDTTTQKIINIKNCGLKFENAAKVRTDSAGGNGKGFLHCIGSTGVKIQMSDCHELGAADDAISISMTSYDDKGELFIQNSRPQIIDWDGRSDKLVLKDCDYFDVDNLVQSNTVIVRDTFINLLDVKSNDVKLYNSIVSQVTMTTVDPHTRRDGFSAHNCDFNGNLGVSDTLAFTVLDSEEWRANFVGCTFFNSAGATNTFDFITFSTNFGFVSGASNQFDARVTNYASRPDGDFTTPLVDVNSDMPFGNKVALAV